MTGFVPFEVLSDAVGELSADGEIVPHNAPMREVLAAITVPRLDALLPEAALQNCLRSGESVTVEIDSGTYELRSADGWLIGVRVARVDQGELAHRRALALAAAAGSIAHDLANLFGAAFGIVDTLGAAVHAEADRKLLDGLAEGVRRGSQLCSAIERQLRAPRRRRAVADAREVVESVGAMLGKVVQHRALMVDLRTAAELPPLRADGIELKQLLLHFAFLAIELGAERFAVDAERERTAAGRSCVRFSLVIQGRSVNDSVVAATAATMNLAVGSLQHDHLVPTPARDVAVAALALLRRGGSLIATEDGKDLRVAVRVPARVN